MGGRLTLKRSLSREGYATKPRCASVRGWGAGGTKRLADARPGALEYELSSAGASRWFGTRRSAVRIRPADQPPYTRGGHGTIVRRLPERWSEVWARVASWSARRPSSGSARQPPEEPAVVHSSGWPVSVTQPVHR